MSERLCVCPCDDARDCYLLRYYGMAGLGAPDREDDPEECSCACHAEFDDYAEWDDQDDWDVGG